MFTPSTPLKAQLWAGDGGLERITVSITKIERRRERLLNCLDDLV